MKILSLALGVLMAPFVATAGTITPDSVTATIDVGETIVIEKTVTTDPTGVGVVDFYFLADNTGSMGGVINNVRTAATALTTALDTTFADAAFGVGRYFGDPVEFGEDFGSAYDVLQPITTTAADAVSSMSSWVASGGGDGPEANLYALHQAATNGADTAGPGTGSGEATGWRVGAQKVVLWFGDVSGHQDTVTLAESITALTGENVIVIGLNSTIAGFGIDSSFADGTGDSRNQASAIVDATGGALVNGFASVPIGDIVTVITAAIGTATSTIDLSLLTVGDTSGLDISFICTDALGCDDVGGGESRTFDMSITGVTPGRYIFDVVSPGVSGATERDDITVGDGGPRPVPEPGTLLLLGSGLLGLSLMRRRRHGEAA
jgi:hypothetical protein